MRAMLVREVGEPAERLRLAEVPEPSPAADQVLIDVAAVGVNFPDILIVQGRYQFKPPLPFSPGLEVAGVVREVGAAVQHLRVGQRVLALTDHGGYAERAVARAADAWAIPDAMPFDQAAAMSVVYQTGWCALTHRANLRAGETLLVHAAAGGVGLAAVQLGKALGARVIATAGTPAKLEVARASGADVCLDYRTADWVEAVKRETGGAGADVIYDSVGGDIFDASTRCIAFEGRLLVVGFAGGRIADLPTNRALLKNIGVVGVHWGLYRRHAPALVDEWMARLLALYTAGKIKPLVWKTFPLTEAVAALAALGGRESVGKIVLLP